MATINYNGMELEEVTTPQIFDPPREMLVWDMEYDGFNKALVACVLDKEKYKFPVRTVKRREAGKYLFIGFGFMHCALLPDSPKLRRATNRELARWLAQGNGEVLCSDNRMIHSYWEYDRLTSGLSICDYAKVRKWSDTEWHEPTVEYLFGVTNKEAK